MRHDSAAQHMACKFPIMPCSGQKDSTSYSSHSMIVDLPLHEALALHLSIPMDHQLMNVEAQAFFIAGGWCSMNFA